MSMRDWISALDKQIVINQRKLLEGSGCVSHQQAMDKAEKEFEIYRKREMEQLESDFDKEVKRLKKIETGKVRGRDEQIKRGNGR